MAMNLGYKTRYLIIGRKESVIISNSDYTAGFVNGLWTGSATLTEAKYLDLGIVTDEREEFSSGGIPLSVPTIGADTRINWNVGGKIIRLTLTGIIPDGTYVPISDTSIYSGKSNTSVFRYKINKYFGYSALLTNDTENQDIMPNVVQYRRTYLFEKTVTGTLTYTNLACWTVTSYSFSFINGTRHGQYTLTLDLSNNTPVNLLNSPLNDPSYGIRPRDIGDIK